MRLLFHSGGVVEPTRGTLITEISADDDMFPGSEEIYFRSGQSALECVGLAMQGAKKEQIATILDLPCGYGRILRALKAAFPDAGLTACDLNHEAVDFCAKTFLATPIYSSPNPSDIPLEATFDLIWCGSLFTHLDPQRFTGFIEFLSNRLNPDGLLCFTTNGNHARNLLARSDSGSPEELTRSGRYFPPLQDAIPELLASYATHGFAYSEYAEIAYFKTLDSFGATLSSPAWVCKQLQEAGLRLVAFVESGYDGTQDFVACVPEQLR